MNNFNEKENLITKIKKIDYTHLQSVADSIRDELIQDVSISGGHLASNLGVVELTIAIHKVFDSPKDKIIWDVGHQCYVHKMLTGRREEMKNIRKFGGISGFPKRSESVHDMYDSGHSSTSISAALGYAKARDLKGENYSCVAVIGDGALTGGVALEALNYAGDSKTPLIIILNDNQMSISSSVGGLDTRLNKLRTSSTYVNFKKELKGIVSDNPELYDNLRKARDKVKGLFLQENPFEDMGLKYYGPIDGHNIPEMCSAFEFAKTLDSPVVIHVVTKKGKGYQFAEENPAIYHGVGSFDIDKAINENKNLDNWSNIFGDELLKLAKEDKRIVGISAAMVNATGLGIVQNELPEQVFDVGIAEQHAVSFAAGMALNGLKPVVAIYSTFLQRAYDEIITEVCLQNLPVVFAIDRAGVTGADGETHQGMFDIAYLNSMPNMTILTAYDEGSFRSLIDYALTLNSPCAIRYPKTKPILSEKLPDYEVGPKLLLNNGIEALIFTDGSFAQNAILAAKMSSKKISVCDIEVLKPLDVKFIEKVFSYITTIITIEDGTVIGGFGSEISKIAARHGNIRVLNLGWPDQFIEHGSIDELRRKYELDPGSICKKMEAFIEG